MQRDLLKGSCSTYKRNGGDFPGGLVVKTSPSNAGGVGLIPDPWSGN